MNESPDLLIIGAGPTGCTIARQAADLEGWNSVIVDRRHHIAGLCHDKEHENGVLVHEFGPHLFRTNDKKLVDYLSQFTDWVPGKYYVKSLVNGKLYPFPINLTTLEMFFNREFNEDTARVFLDSICEPVSEPSNAEEWVCSRIGREMYQAFYLNYTLKQWGCHPTELDPMVCGRVPIRFNRDERYVDHEFQITPREGFTRMFQNMISHPGIRVLLNTSYTDVKSKFTPRIATVYSGPIDEYFEFNLGSLPWRSLKFEFESYEVEYKQPCMAINYPNQHDYTRSVEIKHTTGQNHPNTVVCYEYPVGGSDPFYPVLTKESKLLFRQYEELAEIERHKNQVYFAGRLGNFSYINTDEAIEQAIELFDDIRQDFIG